MPLQTSVFDKNPYAWSRDGSSYEITSQVVTLNTTDRKGQRKLRSLTISLQRGSTVPVPSPETYSTRDTRAGPDGWLYHRMTLRSGSSVIVARFQLPSDLSRVVAYFRTGRAPKSSRLSTTCNAFPYGFPIDVVRVTNWKSFKKQH